MAAVRGHLGEVRFDDPSTMVALEGNVRVRRAVAKATPALGRYEFDAGEGDFDFLAIGLEGPDVVWIFPCREEGFTVREGLVLVDNVDHPEGWKTARLSADGRSFRLRPYLTFARDSTRSASADMRVLRSRQVSRRESLKNARRRPQYDPDFGSLLETVSARLGQMNPLSNFRWQTRSLEKVHLSISKPLHGRKGRAFIGFSKTMATCDWLAVAVVDDRDAWLIPVERIRSYLEALDVRENVEIQLGFKFGEDYLWKSPFDPKTAVAIGDCRIREEPGRREAFRRSLAAKSEAPMERQRTLEKKRRARLLSQPDEAEAFAAISSKLGPLKVRSSAPPLLETRDGRVVRMIARRPIYYHPRRIYFIFNMEWLDEAWFAFAIKGTGMSWLLPSTAISERVVNLSVREDQTLIFYAGEQEGRDRLWTSSEPVLDLTEYRLRT